MRIYKEKSSLSEYITKRAFYNLFANFGGEIGGVPYLKR